MSTSIYLADPEIREGMLDTLRARLPAGWDLSDDPDGADGVLTANVDVDAASLIRRGANLRLVAKLEPGNATIRADSVPVVKIPNTALTGVAELTVTLIFALVKNLRAVHEATRARAWLDDRSEPILTDQQRYTYNWIGIDDTGGIRVVFRFCWCS